MCRMELFYALWNCSHIVKKKKHHLHSKWTLLKSCCFFLISLRSIINLAHDFKSPFLDIEITISNKLYQKVTTRPSFTFINPYLALHHSGLHIIHLCPQSRGNHRKNLRFVIPSFNLLFQEVMIILTRCTEKHVTSLHRGEICINIVKGMKPCRQTLI